MHLDPSLDRVFLGETTEPNASESQMWNLSDGRYGLMYHIGTMPGDLGLWHNALSINCPDGSVLATKLVGRNNTGAFGCQNLFSRTEEPYKAWTIEFDGAMRRYEPRRLAEGPGEDGAHVSVRVRLNLRASHPVWEPGARSDEAKDSIFHTFAKMHHEQALIFEGSIEIGSTKIPYAGVGHRDHSRGPRDMRNLLRGAWFNATFESGWAFLGFWGEDQRGVVERSAVFEAGNIIVGSMEHDAGLSTTEAEPRAFEVRLRTDDGKRRVLRVKCTQEVNWFSDGLSEWCVGSSLSDPTYYNWAMAFADFECEGEKGTGFIDRGALAKLLRRPQVGSQKHD